MLPKDIFPENFKEIEQEMAEKIANQTRTKNNNNQKRSRCAQRVGLPYDSEQMRYDGK